MTDDRGPRTGGGDRRAALEGGRRAVRERERRTARDGEPPELVEPPATTPLPPLPYAERPPRAEPEAADPESTQGWDPAQLGAEMDPDATAAGAADVDPDATAAHAPLHGGEYLDDMTRPLREEDIPDPREYERRRALAAADPLDRLAASAGVDPEVARRPPATVSRGHVLAMWIAGGLVALLALVALFAVGTRIPELTAEPEPTAAPAEPEPEPAPTFPALDDAGPVAPGTAAWTDLRGGECLDPFTGAWAEEFTVVDCAAPHAAQLTVRRAFPDLAADAPYPGAADLQSRVGLLCSAGDALDYGTAAGYADIVMQASYAADEEQWAAGLTSYSCFASRSSGEPIEGGLAPAV